MDEIKYASPSKSPDVFLSYSHNDAGIVEKIAAGLESEGFSCWIDSDNLRHDDDFHILIQEGIRNCLVFISFLSESYVNKEYCQREFALARDEGKSIVSLTIDSVSKSTNRNAAYMFGFMAGKTNKNYGKCISEEDVDSVVEFLKETYQLQKLSLYYSSGDKKDIPSPSLPEAVFDTLRFNLDKQFELRANYALGDVSNILFPSVLDVRENVVFRDVSEKMTSLTRYVADKTESAERCNLFLYGDGGMGKTVAMLKTAQYLLEKGIPAVYIPLSKIKDEDSIAEYIAVEVLHGNEQYKKILYDFMSLDMSGAPAVVLLFDGVNELSADKEKTKRIVERIRSDFASGYAGTDFIITSRWDDPDITGRIKDVVIPLEMQKFDVSRINRYLSSEGLAQVTDPGMLSVLSTPLLLTLYANVEQHIGKYGKVNGVELCPNPDSPAKILRNFFLTQLFRASAEPYFDRTTHYVLLEYFLPAIAFESVKDEEGAGKVKSSVMHRMRRDIDRERGRYDWFIDDKLLDFTDGNISVDTNLLIATAAASLHFITKTSEDEYEFTHQSFRDYFAAYHIVNEIDAFACDKRRAREEESLLTIGTLSDDILTFVADIAGETSRQPVRTENGYFCGGKNSPSDKSESPVENMLELFRDKQGEEAQNAVYNIFNIMRIGRGGKLAFCDFSRLDMRKCELVNSVFVNWFNDKIYPCLFDGAYINMSSFIKDGHSAAVTAICTDGRDLIFSGDADGKVRISSISEHVYTDKIDFSDKAVIDIAYCEKNRKIAAVTRNELLIYSLDDKSAEITENPRRDTDYRYTGFDKNGNVPVSSTFEPLMPRLLSGELTEDFPADWGFDVPAGCAKWHPTDEKFVRSRMGQTITATVRADDGKNWWMHPAFKDIMIQQTEGFSDKETLSVKKALNEMIKNNTGFCVKVQASTVRGVVEGYVLCIGRDMYFYEIKKKRISKKISFAKDIDSVYFASNLISVYIDSRIIVLDPQLKLYTSMLSLRYFNKEFKNETVSCMSFNEDGSRLLVCIGQLLLEFDFGSLTLIKKTNFTAGVRSAVYCGDKIIVGAGKQIFVMTSGHVLIEAFESSNQSDVKNIIEDIDGDGCYVLSSGYLIKKLNRDLQLVRVRRLNTSASGFQWVKNISTGKCSMLIKATQEYPFGRVMDFETAEVCPMNESFRVADVPVNEDDMKYYPIGSKVIAFDKRPPYNKISFTNYSGVFIFGCSFKDVRGDIALPEGREFIISNGGITDG